MPKQTFFNLPKKKQNSLIKAAKFEFSRVPLHEASIANIIKYAKISRGSFYQYFYDKEDLFFFLLDEIAEDVQNQLFYNLQALKGDLFRASTETYRYLYNYFIQDENRYFLRNAFLNMNHKIQRCFFPNPARELKGEKIDRLLALIDKTMLNVDNRQELVYGLQVIIIITFHNAIHSFAQEKKIEDALKMYLIELNLIKKGIYKEEVINT